MENENFNGKFTASFAVAENDDGTDFGAPGDGTGTDETRAAELPQGKKGPIGRFAGGNVRWWTSKRPRSVVQRVPQLAALSDRFRAFNARFCQSARRWPHGQMRVSKRAERQIRRLVPALLVLSVFVYVLLGAAAFLFFEHTNHEQNVRNWFFNLIENRHKFARQISSAIFNGTRNMLIIVDYDSSERIQRDLVHLLSQYERQLSLRMPDLNEWTLENSLAYAWGLLTTIGHGHRSPKTRGGQIFALFYCLLGVPFFVVTLLVVSRRLIELCRIGLHFVEQKFLRPSLLAQRHSLLMPLVLSLYILWLLLFSVILHVNAISESYWRSLYTAVLSSLTIQSADYNALSEPHKILCLGGCTLSLVFACVAILSLTGAYRHKNNADGDTGETETVAMGQQRKTKRRRSSTGGASTSSGVTTNNTAPKFQMTVVDEKGATKLVPISPAVENAADQRGENGR